MRIKNQRKKKKPHASRNNLTEGQAQRLVKLLPEQHFTQPPPRYSEATPGAGAGGVRHWPSFYLRTDLGDDFNSAVMWCETASA